MTVKRAPEHSSDAVFIYAVILVECGNDLYVSIITQNYTKVKPNFQIFRNLFLKFSIFF